MLTIEDLRNPKRKSGFDHVNGTGVPGPRGGGGLEKWRAAIGPKSGVRTEKDWRGPRRSTSKEAAQDYCDYVNSQKTKQPPARLNSAGHRSAQRDPLPRDEEVEAALGVLKDKRAQRRGRKGYVYCIGEGAGGTPGYGVKIGYSVNPPKRVIELQTGNPRVLTVLGTIEGSESLERELHAKYIDYNLIGEWFSPTPALLAEFGLTPMGQSRERNSNVEHNAVMESAYLEMKEMRK